MPPQLRTFVATPIRNGTQRRELGGDLFAAEAAARDAGVPALDQALSLERRGRVNSAHSFSTRPSAPAAAQWLGKLGKTPPVRTLGP